MKIVIYQNREVYKDESKIGNDSENKVETLEFEFPEEYKDFSKYIEFQIKGEKYTDIIENNRYEITRAIAQQGKIKTQIVLRKNTENDVLVFKSNVFELTVSKSINATENIPEEYPTWIDNLERLKSNLEKSEQERVTSEESRIEAEIQREETEMQREATFTQMEAKVENAVKEIADKKADYNQNALEKTNEYNELVGQKTNAFNSNAEIRTNNFNQNTIEKTTAFDTNVETKTNEYNTNATNKTTEFNNNAKSKTDTYNSNAETKTNEYNTNTEIKTEQFNTNAENKNNTFNSNAQDKINEYNNNAITLIERVNSVEKENIALQSECERLKSDIKAIAIPGQAVGENITLNDSSDARFRKFDIGGNAKQETREGYNLLDLSGFTSIDKNGIVATKNEDDSIILNGTCTSSFGIYVSVNKTLSVGSYTHSIGAIVPSEVYISLDSTNITMINNSTGSKKTFEITEETLYREYLIWINAGVTLSNLTIYPMIYKGIEDKPFEKYGAMPSPEFESPVKTVGQNVNVFSSVNLSNCSINIDGTINKRTDRICTDYIKIKPNTSYTLSVSTASDFMGLAYYDNDLNYISRTTNNSMTTLSIITPENARYIKAFVSYSNVIMDISSIEKYCIKLELGPVARPYSPYGMGNAEIKICNKNLFDYRTIKYGISIDPSTGNYADNNNFFSSDDIVVKPNTKYSTGSSYLAIFEYSDNKILRNYDCDSKYFTTHQDTTKIRIRPYWIKNMPTNEEQLEYAKKVQIEEGEATEYEEHKEQTYTIPTQKEFAKIGDVKDTFVKQDGKWYEKHCIIKRIFNGSDGTLPGGDFSGLLQNGNIARTIPVSELALTPVRDDIMSDCLQTKATSLWGGVESGIQTFNNQANVLISIPVETIKQITGITEITSDNYVTAFNQCLSIKNITAYIVLAEPQLIECTKEQSAILDEIEKTIHTYKGQTHIYSTDEVSPIFDIEYNVDTQSYIDNQINTVVNAVVELGGTVNV